jgi:hypothetical protein
MTPDDVVAFLVPRTHEPLKAFGLEPLGWHPAVGGTLPWRRIKSEPGLAGSERGRPPHPPRIPNHPMDVGQALTEALYALRASRRLAIGCW